MTGLSVAELLQKLVRDRFRDRTPFSEDIAEVNEILFHPYATSRDREVAVARWLQGNQPCLFGKIAAARDGERLQICVLSDEDLRKPDEFIAARIQDALLAWKRRSFRPHPEISTPAHGFVLVIASERVCLAEPNADLANLADRILRLWGVDETKETHGSVFWESLYLERPADGTVFKFSVMIDYFAAHGDGRWWADHRFPGGIAFTANSAGHMARYREWYEGKGNQSEWVLSTAMRTIAGACPTEYGPATWLRSIDASGRPFVEAVACPFALPSAVHKDLAGKDWTRYGGYFHTDQSVRKEFFGEGSPADLVGPSTGQWLLDFTYLYSETEPDFQRLMAGQSASMEQVCEAIGRPSEWTRIPTRTPAPREPSHKRLSPRATVSQLVTRFRSLSGVLDVARRLRNLARWEYHGPFN